MNRLLKIDATEVVISFLLSRLLDHNLPSFKIQFLFKKKKKIPIINRLVKDRLNKLSELYLYPNFSGKELTPELIDSFYNTLIRVSELPVKNFKYYKSNLATEMVSDMESLIIYLSAEKCNPQRNDSRYMLGFRSLWYILNENKETLTPEYLQEIIDSLQPFFVASQRKVI